MDAYKNALGRGYDNSDKLDDATARLCGVMDPAKMSTMSKQLQKWWAKHQDVDKARAEAEGLFGDLYRGLTTYQKAFLRRFL